MWGARRSAQPHIGWRDAVIDVGPPIGLWASGLLDMTLGIGNSIGSASPLTSLVPMTIVCLLLLLRRRRPLSVLCGIAVVITVPIWFLPLALSYWGQFMPWLLALYSTARHGDRPLWRALGIVISAAMLTVIAIRFPEISDPGDLLYNGTLIVGAWLLGLFARSWSQYRDDAVRQEAERARAEEAAKRSERARIARELHDVISHTITVVVMQAGGARLAAIRDPEVAVTALARIEALGQESLAELRSLLRVLRDEDDAPGETGPQPGLADIPELCERMRALGLPVRLRQEQVAGVPAGVQLAAYRIVQEGLTNALKHAGPVDTEVRIGSGAGGVLGVEISNAPPFRSPRLLEGAHRGLTGIRERVTAIGGAVDAESRPDGGFAIRAGLPTGEHGL